jgi:hypothetical protein
MQWEAKMESSIETIGQDARMEEVARQVGDLPSLPAAAAEALRLLDDPSVSADDLQRVIGRDQALAAHILRIANSAMYCLQRQVSVLSHAIAILGLDALRSVVVAASIRSVFYSGRRRAFRSTCCGNMPGAQPWRLKASRVAPATGTRTRPSPAGWFTTSAN